MDGFGLKPLAKLGFELFEAFGAAAQFEFTLPDNDGVPAQLLQAGYVFRVAFLVAADFLRPEIGVGLGESGVAAKRVAVPEAAVDEDVGAILRQDEIGVTIRNKPSAVN